MELCNRTQTKSLIGVLALAGALMTLDIAHAQVNPQKDVEAVIRDFLVAFSTDKRLIFVNHQGLTGRQVERRSAFQRRGIEV